jgi:copper chaperone
MIEITRTYTVAGMHCDHCALSVREEVCELPGVHDVDVDVPTGTVVVRAESLDDEAVRAAVAEAGYAVTS